MTALAHYELRHGDPSRQWRTARPPQLARPIHEPHVYDAGRRHRLPQCAAGLFHFAEHVA